MLKGKFFMTGMAIYVIIGMTISGICETKGEIEKMTNEDRLSKLIIDRLNFEKVTVPAALKYVKMKAKQADKEKIGVNIIVLPLIDPRQNKKDNEGIPMVTMVVNKISAKDAVIGICQAANTRYRIDENAVIVAMLNFPLKKFELKIPSSAPKDFKENLTKKLPHFDVDEASIDYVVQGLSRKSGVNFILSIKKQENSPFLTLDLDSISVKEIIEYICEGTGLKGSIEGNNIILKD